MLVFFVFFAFYSMLSSLFSLGVDTDSLNIETDIEEETVEFFIKEEIEVLEDSE